MQIALGVTSGWTSFNNRPHHLPQLAEKSGFNTLWIGEDIDKPRDIFTLTSIVLLQTRTIRVGIGITSPLIRNVSTIARAAVTLAEMGDTERFVLGLGVGGLQDLGKLGIEVRQPTAMLRDVVNLLRSIWKGEAVTFESNYFQLERYSPRFAADYDIPIFFGVRGPKLLELAGEIADGAIISGPKRYLAKAVELVKKGIEKRGKQGRAFQIVVWMPTILTEKKTDVALAKQAVAIVLADTAPSVVEMAELDAAKVEGIKQAFQRGGLDKAASMVTDELLQETAIHGNAEQLCHKFEGVEKKLGADEVVFGPPYGVNRQEAMMRFAETWKRRRRRI